MRSYGEGMEGEAEDRREAYTAACAGTARAAGKIGHPRMAQVTFTAALHGGMMGAGQATVSLRDIPLILAKTVHFEDQSSGHP